MGNQVHKGCVLAAPHSGAGKTLVTLGLLRALRRQNIAVESAKVGPDYIDPAFHHKASGRPCHNLDLWAMGKKSLLNKSFDRQALLIIEGVMGLFDGADNGYGSTADIAALYKLPVFLIIDASAQGQSAAALLHGFKTYRDDVAIKGIIFNRVASTRHGEILKRAAQQVNLPVLGLLPKERHLMMPSRHLGLVQAVENEDLENFIERAADFIADYLDIALLQNLMEEPEKAMGSQEILAPLGQKIAIAKDKAFSFLYPHLLEGWQNQGACLSFFSPLENEAPEAEADAVFLPGGYPELYADRLSANSIFLSGLKSVTRTALIYGECGGFMVMGDGLVDSKGVRHKMAGLLPHVTSFQEKKRHLGYRKLSHQSALPWPIKLRGHEFHYSNLIGNTVGTPLFEAETARGEELLPMGLQEGRIMGSYAHIISSDEEE